MTRKEIWELKKEVFIDLFANLNYAELSDLGKIIEDNKKYRVKMAAFKFYKEDLLRKVDIQERFNDVIKGF